MVALPRSQLFLAAEPLILPAAVLPACALAENKMGAGCVCVCVVCILYDIYMSVCVVRIYVLPMCGVCQCVWYVYVWCVYVQCICVVYMSDSVCYMYVCCVLCGVCGVCMCSVYGVC